MQKFIPFVDTLIENINKPSKPNNINIILDGGGFNGSYHHGVLIYFNQLEKKHYVKINKISGCSIGSVFGMLYLLDLLGHEVYRMQLLLNQTKVGWAHFFFTLRNKYG